MREICTNFLLCKYANKSKRVREVAVAVAEIVINESLMRCKEEGISDFAMTEV